MKINHSPGYLKTLLPPTQGIIQTDRHALHIYITTLDQERGDKSTTNPSWPKSIREWNALDADIKSLPTISWFKSGLKSKYSQQWKGEELIQPYTDDTRS